MDADLARRTHDLLMKALALDAADRTSYIRGACSIDPLLCDRVSELLEALERSEQFLNAPVQLPGMADRPGGPLAAPRAIRNYRIVRTIGAGGMATVYEAIQEQPQRRVALKVLRHGLARTSAIERFRFETEVLARLRHPGIAQIFEAGAYDDGHGVSLPFFTMEFIADARTITEYARDRSLTLAARLELFLTVCDAVQYGHQNGVIHRDLKPGNILVDDQGRPRVIDFGVARLSDPAAASITRESSPGQIVGTLNYMSPEQCSSDAPIDIRTDVYSLGVMLYELVCGRLPHDLAQRPAADAIRAICEESPPRPGAIDGRLRGDVDAIVMKALEKEPRARYATVAELAADVGRHLRNESVEARPPTLTYRAVRFVRRHRLLVAACAVALLAVVGGAVISAAFAYQTWRESQRRAVAERAALSERDAARWNSYVASVAAAFSSLGVQEYRHARTRVQAAPAEHRGWEWRYLAAQVENSELTVAAHDDMIYGFGASADAALIATGCRDGSLRVWDAATGALRASCEGTPGAPIYSLAVSPDGTRILTGSGDCSVRAWDAVGGREVCTLGRHASGVHSVAWGSGSRAASASTDGVARIWDAELGESEQVLDDQPGGIHGIRFTPDGSQLLTWGPGGEVWLRNAENAEAVERLSFGDAPFCVAVSPDGALIAVGGSEGRLLVWDAQSGAVLRDLTDATNPSTVRAVTFSPGGERLAAGFIARSIALYDLDTGERLRSLHGHEEAVSGLAFSQNGCHLYSAAWDGTLRIWELAATDQSGLTLKGHRDFVLATAFSPDSSILASAGRDRGIRLWNGEGDEAIGVLNGHAGTVSSLAFAPDGDALASGSYDGTARIWSMRTGECSRVLRGHDEPVWTVAYSPEGHMLATGGDDNTIRVWNIEFGETIHTLTGHAQRVIQVAFSPDGRTLASASRDESVRLWDVQTGAAVRTLLGHQSDVFAVIFSPDGKRLFSGSRDQRVRVWDVASGDCVRVLGGHGQFVTSLSLLPDGARLAAGSWFGEIVLWDVPRLEIVANFKGSPRPIRAVAFSPDGRRLAIGTYEKTVRLLDAPREDESSRAQPDESEPRQNAARRLVDQLVSAHKDASAAADALNSRTEPDPKIRAIARRLLLARALAQRASP